jgi:hypothetical protein
VTDLPKEKRIYCNSCKLETRHNLIAAHEYEQESSTGTYILWVCAGCNTATMEDCYHELSAPNSGELNVALDLIEDILNYLYDLDYKASMFAGLDSAQKKTP